MIETYYHVLITGIYEDGYYTYTYYDVNESEKNRLVDAYKLAVKFIAKYNEIYPTINRYLGEQVDDVRDLLYELLDYDDKGPKFSDIVKDYEWVKDLYTLEQLETIQVFLDEDIPWGYDCCIHTLCNLEVYECINKEIYEKRNISECN